LPHAAPLLRLAGGAALLPMTGAIMLLMGVVGPRVVARFGPKMPIVAGMLLLAAVWPSSRSRAPTARRPG
jgi:hypothetical protein